MPLDFKAKTTQTNIIILELSGDISFDTVPIFRKSVYALVQHHIKYLVLDMKNIKFVDSIGIGALIAAHRFLTKNNGKLALVITGSHLLRLMQTTQLTKILQIYSSSDEADIHRSIALERFFEIEEAKPDVEIISSPTKMPFDECIGVEIEMIDNEEHPLCYAEIKKIETEKSLMLFVSNSFTQYDIKLGDRMVVYASGEDTSYEFEVTAFRVVNNSILSYFPREIQKIEKRNSKRVACRIPVRFQACDVLGEVHVSDGDIDNISITGVSILTASPFPDGECIGLTFTLPTTNRSLTILGKVVRQRKIKGVSHVGLRFLLLSENDKQELEGFISLGSKKHISFYHKMAP